MIKLLNDKIQCETKIKTQLEIYHLTILDAN